MVPNNLASLRRRSGKSQDELAEAANTTRNYYGKLERGERPLTMEYLERLAAALNVAPFQVIAPPDFLPTEDEFVEMLAEAQAQIPASLPYGEWPRAVAEALKLRLDMLLRDRSRAGIGDRQA